MGVSPVYLTYEEYQAMGGTMDVTSYDNFEFEAEAIINWYTFNRLKNDTEFPEAVKRLMKYLIDTAQQKANLLQSGIGSGSSEGTVASAISSQSNDGVSISYNVLSASELMNSLKDQESNTVNRYLQGVTNEAGRLLLYRGVYPNE